jgi:hypothetical protein
MEKPEVDSIEGLSPAIAIEQRSAGSNPRSTVATITEIYDYLRLLFARLGTQHCPKCDTVMRRQSVQEIVDLLAGKHSGVRVTLLAPMVRGRKGEYRKELESIRRQGYVRARIDGAWVELEDAPKLARYKRHDIDVVVDRLTVDGKSLTRLADSLESALKLGNGLVAVAREGEKEDLLFSQGAACPNCGTSVEEPQPRTFSFNSPYGACAACDGLGTLLRVDPVRVVPDPAKSIEGGAIASMGDATGTWTGGTLRALAKKFDFSLKTPWKKLPAKAQRLILQGSGDQEVRFEYKLAKGSSWVHTGTWEGVIPNLERRYRTTSSERVRKWILSLMNPRPCPDCRRAAAQAREPGGAHPRTATSPPGRECRWAAPAQRSPGCRLRAPERPSPSRSSRRSPAGSRSSRTSGSATSRSTARREPWRAARPSASGWRPRSARSSPGSSTSSTSPRSGSTIATTCGCSRPSSACGIWATRWWWSSTTATRWRRPTGWSTWARARDATADAWWRPAPRRRCGRRPTR